jgi:hypothetical protein
MTGCSVGVGGTFEDSAAGAEARVEATAVDDAAGLLLFAPFAAEPTRASARIAPGMMTRFFLNHSFLGG